MRSTLPSSALPWSLAVGRRLDARQVTVDDVPPIFPQMRGDAVAAARGNDLRRAPPGPGARPPRALRIVAT